MMASMPVANNSQTTTPLGPPEQGLKCPRCDSPNTKFCYYNNYSLTQPRHFCKTCRRYWTRGGALRNVPIGGGCRKKNKKSKSISSSSASASSSISPSSSSNLNLDLFDPSGAPGHGLNFFGGVSSAVDFQLGVHPFSSTGFLSSNGQLITSATTSMVLGGFNYSQLPPSGGGGYASELGVMNNNSNTHHHHSRLASSIESLSSINQDLHWKLQQQRLQATFYPAAPQQPVPVVALSDHDQQQAEPEEEPMTSFQVTDGGPRKGCVSGNETTSWFLEGSCTNTNNNGANSTTSRDNNTVSWNGIMPTWNDMHHFAALP